jgi:hypothetical protein
MFDKATEAKLEEMNFEMSALARFPLTHGDKLKQLETEYLLLIETSKRKAAEKELEEAGLPQAIFKAELQTRNFTFEAYASTEEEAKNLIAKHWKKHVKRTGATYTWEELEEDVYVSPIVLGQTYQK